jgi:hypothetical protein
MTAIGDDKNPYFHHVLVNSNQHISCLACAWEKGTTAQLAADQREIGKLYD